MSHLMAGVVPLGYRAPEASHLPPLPVQLFLAYQHLSAALLAANPVSNTRYCGDYKPANK